MKHYSSRVAAALWLTAAAGCADMHADDTFADKPEIASSGEPGAVSARDDAERDVDAPAATSIEESQGATSSVQPPAAQAAAAPTASVNPVTQAPAPPVHPTPHAPPAVVVEMTAIPAALPACEEGLLVTGRLDANSSMVSAPFGSWLADTYLFSATTQGTVSIWSSARPVGDAYPYGYGFPFTVEALGASETPALSANRAAGMPLADNALDDGKARVDIQAEPGKRYLVTFKALIGSANQGSSWDYTLSFCPNGLKLAGKLQP